MISKEYKSTGIGIIPKDWDEYKVADNFTSVANNSLSRDCLNNEGGTYMNVHYGDILVKYGNILTVGKDDIPYVNDDVKLNSTRCLRNGDIIIADTAEDETAGKTVEIQGISDTPILSGLHTLPLRPSVDFAPKYLGYFFNSGFYHNQLIPYMQGTKVLSISKKSVGETTVVAPSSLDEQKRIATTLSDIDTYLTTLEAAITKKRLLKQGAMQQLLTGKTRLPGFTDPWVEKTIGDIGRTYNGITGKTKDDFGVGEAKYVTFLNILNNPTIDSNILERVNISPNERQNAVLAGDLFFNTSSETPEEVGICATIKNNIPDLYLNSFCFGYRLIDKEISSLYLSYYFRSSMGRAVMTSLAQGATRYNLSKENFYKIVISVPSTIKEQEAISLILTTMDDEISALQREHTKYTLIKQGMMQKLLTGQIRLPQPCQSQE